MSLRLPLLRPVPGVLLCPRLQQCRYLHTFLLWLWLNLIKVSSVPAHRGLVEVVHEEEGEGGQHEEDEAGVHGDQVLTAAAGAEWMHASSLHLHLHCIFRRPRWSPEIRVTFSVAFV